MFKRSWSPPQRAPLCRFQLGARRVSSAATRAKRGVSDRDPKSDCSCTSFTASCLRRHHPGKDWISPSWPRSAGNWLVSIALSEDAVPQRWRPPPAPQLGPAPHPAPKAARFSAFRTRCRQRGFSAARLRQQARWASLARKRGTGLPARPQEVSMVSVRGGQRVQHPSFLGGTAAAKQGQRILVRTCRCVSSQGSSLSVLHSGFAASRKLTPAAGAFGTVGQLRRPKAPQHFASAALCNAAGFPGSWRVRSSHKCVKRIIATGLPRAAQLRNLCIPFRMRGL